MASLLGNLFDFNRDGKTSFTEQMVGLGLATGLLGLLKEEDRCQREIAKDIEINEEKALEAEVELYERLDELRDELSDLEWEEPEDISSEEYDEWDEKRQALEEKIKIYLFCRCLHRRYNVTQTFCGSHLFGVQVMLLERYLVIIETMHYEYHGMLYNLGSAKPKDNRYIACWNILVQYSGGAPCPLSSFATTSRKCPWTPSSTRPRNPCWAEAA